MSARPRFSGCRSPAATAIPRSSRRRRSPRISFRSSACSPRTDVGSCPQDDTPDTRVAILSHALWTRRFGADPAIVGDAITLNGNAFTVVGIMPPQFFFIEREAALWVTIGLRAEARTPRGRWMLVTARMKPGVTVQQAQAEMDTISARLTAQFPEFNTGWGVNVVPLHRQVVGRVRPAVLTLVAAVGARPPHRVRQRRESAARTRRFAPPRTGRPRRPRRGARPTRPSAHGRERRARGGRRARRPAPGMVGNRHVPHRRRSRVLAASRTRDSAQRPRRALHRRSVARDGAPLRSGAGFCRRGAGSAELAEGRRPRGRRAGRADAEPARRLGDRDRACPARRSRAVDPELRPAGRRRPGLPRGAGPEREDFHSDGPL